jgi:hypothetical protein
MNETKSNSNGAAGEFNKVKENNITTKFSFNFFDENVDINNNINNQKDKKKRKKKKKKKKKNNFAVEEEEEEEEDDDDDYDNNNNNNNIELSDVKNNVEKLLVDTTNNIENLAIIDSDKSLEIKLEQIKLTTLETETKPMKNKSNKKKKGHSQQKDKKLVETTYDDDDDDFSSLIATFTKADQIALENDQTLKQTKEQIIKPNPNSKIFFKSHKDPELDESEKLKAKFGNGKNLTAIGPAKVRDPNWNSYTSPFSFGFGF